VLRKPPRKPMQLSFKQLVKEHFDAFCPNFHCRVRWKTGLAVSAPEYYVHSNLRDLSWISSRFIWNLNEHAMPISYGKSETLAPSSPQGSIKPKWVVGTKEQVLSILQSRDNALQRDCAGTAMPCDEVMSSKPRLTKIYYHLPPCAIYAMRC